MERRYEENGTHHSKIQCYLTASEYFLEQGNFEDCRKYALKAIEIDPNHPAPAQILAIAKVLLLSSSTNEDPNHYSILDLPLYTQDQQLIKTNFKNITNLLNPNQNRYPFASVAFHVVLRASSVLSNPTQKTRFDYRLKTKEKGGSFCETESGKTFWTVCPYCYYVYEFFTDYEDCCLRCQNENCRRGFHALPIVGPPPPPEVAEKGEYYCFGFSVFGIEGKSLWSPFVPVRKNDEGCKNEDEFDVDQFMEIFDDEAEDENGRKEKSIGVEEKLVRTNGGEVNKECEKDKGCRNMGGNFKKRRIKMVAKSSKKVLGKGNRVNMNEVVYSEGTEGENFEAEFGNVREKTNENNIDFFVGDDNDIYVCLQEDFDMGVGDIETLFF